MTTPPPTDTDDATNTCGHDPGGCDDRPYVLLDVDGVINVWPSPPAVEGHVHTEVDGWSIWYNTAVVERINELAERVELRWLTTWREKARDSLAPAIGLAHFDPVPHDINERERFDWPLSWWKLDAADDLIRDNDRRVVWCDDDMDYELRKEIERRYGAERLLLITPEATPGLTLAHLDQIEAFITITEGATP